MGKGKHGMYASWKDDEKHRFECHACKMFPGIRDPTSPLPWRLTKDQLKIVNERICAMWWPHHVHRLAKRRCSFFIKSCRAWKSRDKLTVFLVKFRRILGPSLGIILIPPFLLCLFEGQANLLFLLGYRGVITISRLFRLYIAY